MTLVIRNATSGLVILGSFDGIHSGARKVLACWIPISDKGASQRLGRSKPDTNLFVRRLSGDYGTPNHHSPFPNENMRLQTPISTTRTDRTWRRYGFMTGNQYVFPWSYHLC